MKKRGTKFLIQSAVIAAIYAALTLALAPLYESPCVPAAPLDLSQNLTVEGTGNPGACVEALRKLFNFSSCDGREDCAFAGVYQPPVQGQFYVSPLSLPSGPSFLLEAKGPDPRRPWGAWDPGWGGLGLSPARPGPHPQGHIAPPHRLSPASTTPSTS